MNPVLDKTSKPNTFEDILTSSLAPKVAVSYLRVSTHGQAERGGGADEFFNTGPARSQ
jgi:hypothetical protein